MPENPRIEELRRRVQADPASIAFAGLAEEFRRVGRYDEAIETCRVGLQRHPAYLSARVTLGRALIEAGDLDGAREELETVLRSAPENLAAIRGLAQIHERLGHSTEMDPHLVALAHAEVPAPAPPVAPTPPPAVERPAAPNFDLDLNFDVAPSREAEPAAEFPVDDSPFAQSRPSAPEYEGLGDEPPAQQPAAPDAGVPLTMEAPVTLAEPKTSRTLDLDLGLTFTLAPAPAPRRDSVPDFSFADAADRAPEVPAIEPIPDLPASFEAKPANPAIDEAKPATPANDDAKPAAEEPVQAESPEDDTLVLPTLASQPDPEIAATLLRLEGFLAAIQSSRVHGSNAEC